MSRYPKGGGGGLVGTNLSGAWCGSIGGPRYGPRRRAADTSWFPVGGRGRVQASFSDLKIILAQKSYGNTYHTTLTCMHAIKSYIMTPNSSSWCQSFIMMSEIHHANFVITSKICPDVKSASLCQKHDHDVKKCAMT